MNGVRPPRAKYGGVRDDARGSSVREAILAIQMKMADATTAPEES